MILHPNIFDFQQKNSPYLHSLYNPTWIPWFLSDNENDQTSGPEASNCVASPSFACYLSVSVVSVACIANDKDEMQRMKYKGMKISYVCQLYIMYTSYIIYRSYMRRVVYLL